MTILNRFIKLWIHSYRQRKTLRTLFGQMVSHVNHCPLESNLKFRKLEKLLKLNTHLDSLDRVPLTVHALGLVWLQTCFRRCVLQNGFLNIQQTFQYLELDTDFSNAKDSELAIFNNSQYLKHYQDTIKPMNCQLSRLENTESSIKISRVRPLLPEIDGKLYGLCVEYKHMNYTLRIFGLADQDTLRVYRSSINKQAILKDLHERYSITKDDALPILNYISYRDYLVCEVRQLTNKVKQLKEKIEAYKSLDTNILLSEYQFLQDYMKIDIINLLLAFDMKSKANFLMSKNPVPVYYLDWNCQKELEYSFSDFKPSTSPNLPEQVPYEIRISGLKTTEKNKAKAFEKLKMMSQSSDGAPKAQKYLDGILKIPFGQIKNEPGLEDPGRDLVNELFTKFPAIKNYFKDFGNNYFKILQSVKDFTSDKQCLKMANIGVRKMENARDKQQQYLNKVEEILNKSVHGHDLVKTQMRRLLAQWITGGQSGIVLGLEGPPGNGKTSIIKNGLAKCLVDQQGNPRPVGFIPLGGSSSSSTLVGHGYTYQGSTWGRLVDILMDSECMNPIFLFDELDKVSRTESGREVTSILTHLTDTTQNDEFYDKYFEGVALDVSNALMIFTFNDRNNIDPILLDRMTIIDTKPLSLNDKKIVTRDHLIPQLTESVDLEPSEIQISEEQIEELINDYTREAGARQLKKLLQALIQELNLRRLMNPNTEMLIDEHLINDVFRHRDKIRKETISDNPIVGQINGMYANALGLGGILPIQVSSSVSDAKGKLELTGMQGDVMKESMKCAKTMAFLLADDCKFKKEELSLHIHCPATSTPKDGPSAGGAICSAIYSLLTGKPILQNVAMTGEIDLIGNITAIGGVEAKLNGAKKAGITLALIPKENEQQLERIRKEGKSPESDNFKVIMVDHVKEALKYVIQEN